MRTSENDHCFAIIDQFEENCFQCGIRIGIQRSFLYVSDVSDAYVCMPVIQRIQLAANEIRRIAMSMDQPASALLTATNDHELGVVQVRKLVLVACIIKMVYRDSPTDLSFFVVIL